MVGGGGIAPLAGSESDICELQKMYFLPAIRGKGLAKKLALMAMEQAREMGFKRCYLETTAFLRKPLRFMSIWALSISTMRLAARAMSIVKCGCYATLKKCPLVCAIGHFNQLISGEPRHRLHRQNLHRRRLRRWDLQSKCPNRRTQRQISPPTSSVVQPGHRSDRHSTRTR